VTVSRTLLANTDITDNIVIRCDPL